MYISMTDPCISCVNNVNQKEQKKNMGWGGGGAREIRQTWGGACPKRLKTPAVVNIHLEQWAANAAAPGEQLGVRCLAQGSHLSHGIEGGESAGYSLPPTTIPAGPETRTHDLRITNPTLYTLGHNCPIYIYIYILWRVSCLPPSYQHSPSLNRRPSPGSRREWVCERGGAL